MAELKFSSLAEGKPVTVEVDGEKVCVTRVGDEVFAIADTCTHSEASLSEDRKSTRLNSSHSQQSRMPSSA